MLSSFICSFDSILIQSVLLEMGYSEVRILNSGSGLLEIYIPSLNQNYIDSIRYMPGKLSKLSKRFNLPVKKGSFPFGFVRYENFGYVGDVPSDQNYLSFGQTTLDNETQEYLAERRASDEPWDFAKEMLEYNIADVEVLRMSCERYLEQSFLFQDKLIDRFKAQNPPNKMTHIHPFTKPFVTLAAFSYALMRCYRTSKVKDKMFAIMDPLGKHSTKSSHEEW